MRLGVTQQTLSALERNSIKISAARLLQVLQLFGVELVLRQVSATAFRKGFGLAREPSGYG